MRELTRGYLESLGISHKVTLIPEPSEVALPKLSKGEGFDFAFVDGCHAYPIPAASTGISSTYTSRLGE